MTIVDTHAHASPYWFEPIEVLLFQMDSNGVDKTTLVATTGQTEEKYNQYAIDCARRYPGRISPGIILDPTQEDAVEALKYWAGEGAESIRLELPARSHGNDPLAIWKACGELGIPVSCQAHKKGEFAEDTFRGLVEALPEVTFILEHLGKPKLDEAAPYFLYSKTLELAQYPNVYMKVGGLGEICKRPFPFQAPFYTVEGIPPFIRMAYDAFGASRLMWSSNYPPSSHLEGYRNTLRYVEEHFESFCTPEDKAWIFGKTALTLFRFQSMPR